MVQNEIRNHNLAIEKSNQSLKDIEDRFSQCIKNQNILRSEQASFFDHSRKCYVNEKTYLTDLFNSYKKEIRNVLEKNEEILKKIHNKSENFIQNKFFDLYKDQNNEKFKDLSCQIGSYKNELQKLHVEFEKKIDEKIQSQKDFIEESIYLIKKEIEEKNKLLQANIVDAAGVKRELQAYKKSMFIIEKKIENIYTLLGRLKSGGKA